MVDVWPTVAALVAGAARLRAAAVPADAPPAFLLDADRRVGRVAVTPGVFDNRSVSLPTDFPSAGRLGAGGVRRAILVQAAGVVPSPDLAHTLRRWQEGGIDVRAADGPRLVPVAVARPGGFRSMWHALLATAGLRPHPLGGFGGVLPVPSAG